MEQGNMPPPPPAGKCYVMAFPIRYGLPPMCVEGQTHDSPAHVKVQNMPCSFGENISLRFSFAGCIRPFEEGFR